MKNRADTLKRIKLFTRLNVHAARVEINTQKEKSMTRINVVPVTELTDKHLVAEYRELPRVFALARRATEAPSSYVLGTGHVKFFYNKLYWCFMRQQELVKEMLQRGFAPSFDPQDLFDTWYDKKCDLWNDYTPTPEALEINRQRIKERLEGKIET